MPERAAGRAPRPSPRGRKYRHPSDELVARAARRVVRGAKASFGSQVAFRSALLALLRRDEPLATIGGARLRRLVVGVPGVRLTVRYTENPRRATPLSCPVCSSDLLPILNRTLDGATVVLGRRCPRCDYWTHLPVRVPVRYVIAQGSGRGRRAR